MNNKLRPISAGGKVTDWINNWKEGAGTGRCAWCGRWGVPFAHVDRYHRSTRCVTNATRSLNGSKQPPANMTRILGKRRSWANNNGE